MGVQGASPPGRFSQSFKLARRFAMDFLSKISPGKLLVLSFLLFLNVLILGCLLLVATGKVVF